MWIGRSFGGFVVPAMDRRKRRGFNWRWYPGERSMKDPRPLSFTCVWAVLRTGASSKPLAGLLGFSKCLVRPHDM